MAGGRKAEANDTEPTAHIIAQGRALVRAIEALGIVEPSGWFERAIAGLLLAGYKRRLRAVVEVAPSWVGEEIPCASERIGDGPHRLDLSGVNLLGSWCGTMGDLLIAIEEDRDPLVSGQRNLPTIRTILAEEKSAKSGGRWVGLPLL